MRADYTGAEQCGWCPMKIQPAATVSELVTASPADADRRRSAPVEKSMITDHEPSLLIIVSMAMVLAFVINSRDEWWFYLMILAGCVIEGFLLCRVLGRAKRGSV